MSLSISLESAIVKAIESSFSNLKSSFYYPLSKKHSIKRRSFMGTKLVHADSAFQDVTPLTYQFNSEFLNLDRLQLMGTYFQNGVNDLTINELANPDKDVCNHIYQILVSLCSKLRSKYLNKSVSSLLITDIHIFKTICLYMDAVGLTKEGVELLQNEYIPEIRYVKHFIDQVDINDKKSVRFFDFLNQFDYPLDTFIDLDDMGFSVEQMMMLSKDDITLMVRDFLLYEPSFSQLKAIQKNGPHQVLRFDDGVNLNTGKFCKLLFKLEKLGCHEAIDEIYLDNHSILMLPERIGKFSNLRVISLANNALKQLPNSILRLKLLEMLLVSNNQITKIPAVFDGLDALHLVDIRENKIQTVDESVSSVGAIFCFENQMKSGDELVGNLVNFG